MSITPSRVVIKDHFGNKYVLPLVFQDSPKPTVEETPQIRKSGRKRQRSNKLIEGMDEEKYIEAVRELNRNMTPDERLEQERLRVEHLEKVKEWKRINDSHLEAFNRMIMLQASQKNEESDSDDE